MLMAMHGVYVVEVVMKIAKFFQALQHILTQLFLRQSLRKIQPAHQSFAAADQTLTAVEGG